MRLMFASLAALAVVGLAAPSFAQDATPAAPQEATPAPAPVPAAKSTKAAKPKVGTAAYCNTLKTSHSKAACMKRVASAPKSTHKPSKAHTPTPTTKTDTSAMAAPATPASQATAPAQPQNVSVPPLPQKTI